MQFLESKKDVIRGIASIDQSKLNVTGHTRSLKLNVGKYENVRNRVIIEGFLEVGLSADAKSGVLPHVTLIRKRSIVIKANPMIRKLRICFCNKRKVLFSTDASIIVQSVLYKVYHWKLTGEFIQLRILSSQYY